MTSENNQNLFKQHVRNTMSVFTILMLIFVLMKTIVLFTSASNSPAKVNSLKMISTFAFVSVFFLFSYFTNVSATENKLICGKRNHKIAFYATIVPFVLIYLIGIFIISIFPGWVRCFSNTFGTTFLAFCGLEANIVENLKRSGESGGTNTTTSTIHDLYKENPKILLAELEVNNEGNIQTEVFKELGIEGQNDDKNKTLLKQYIYCKESIGEGIWHYLLGMITILVSYNAILAENCNAFTVQKADFKKYLNDKLQKN